MSDIKLRIRRLINESGMTLEEFAKKIGTHQSSLSRALAKKNNIGDAMINKISIAFDINKDWLMTGEGDEINRQLAKYERGDNLEEDKTIIINQNNLSVMLVPQYSLDVAGGSNNTEADTFGYIIGHTPFTMGRRGDICCPVSGKSMYPNYPPGCIVLLRPIELWKEFLELGRVYVIDLVDERRLIKELKESSDKTCYILHSYNDNYPDIKLKKELIRRVYLVVAKYENELM